MQRFRLAKGDEHARTAFRRAVKQMLGQLRVEETGSTGWVGGEFVGGASIACTGLVRLLTHRKPLRVQLATKQLFFLANRDRQAWTALRREAKHALGQVCLEEKDLLIGAEACLERSGKRFQLL